MQKLTAKFIEKVALPREGQVIIRDTELKGFALRATPGSLSYIVEARVNGRSKRLVIGRSDLYSVQEARKRAIGLLAQMTAGIDPQAEKEKQEASQITLSEALDHYLSVRRMKDLTRTKARRLVNKSFPDWLGKPLAYITPVMVQARHAQLGEDNGHTTANDALYKLSALINFAVDNCGLKIENPVQIMSKNRAWFKETHSPDVLADHQLPAWYQAVRSLKSAKIRDFFLFLLLTGLRRGEALTLRWEQIDFEARMLTIAADDAKNANEHKLPLSDFTLALLAQRKQDCGDSPWVFPRTTNPAFHMEKPQERVEEIEKVCGFPCGPHTLRRSFITVAARMNIPHAICAKLLNHRHKPDISSRYIVIGPEALREPMQKINERLLDLMDCDLVQWMQSDPAWAKRRVTAPTLEETLRAYFLSRKLRLSTQVNYEKALRLDYGDWLNKPITKITEKMVNERKQELLLKKKRVTVFASLGYLRCLFYFAAQELETPLGKPIIEGNPVRNLERFADASYKQTFIADDDLSRWYAAVMQVQWGTARDHLLFCLLTGMRMREGMTLLWSDVNLDNGTVQMRAEACKNGNGYCLPLSSFLLELLKARKPLCKDSIYVFPGRFDRGHLRSAQRAIEEVSRISGVEFVMPDLRRSFIRAALQAGLSQHIVRALVNQAGSRDGINGFESVDLDCLRESMERVSTRLLSFMGAGEERGAQAG